MSSLAVSLEHDVHAAAPDWQDRSVYADVQGRIARNAVVQAWMQGSCEARIPDGDKRSPLISIISENLCATPGNPLFEIVQLIGMCAKGDFDFETRKEIHLRAASVVARMAAEHGELVKERAL